jgi:hypothetical protein
MEAGEQDNGWRISTRCDSSACVQVRLDELVLVRNSAAVDHVLQLDRRAWVDLVEDIKLGGFALQ